MNVYHAFEKTLVADVKIIWWNLSHLQWQVQGHSKGIQTERGEFGTLVLTMICNS